jgi:hypothetical protein
MWQHIQEREGNNEVDLRSSENFNQDKYQDVNTHTCDYTPGHIKLLKTKDKEKFEGCQRGEKRHFM